jgi:amino acid adenylation domain-containing protein
MGLGRVGGLSGLTESQPVHALVAAQAARRPDAPAVAAPDGFLTYGELDRRATQLAHRLLAAGVSAEAPVGLLLPRSAALVVGALGILKAGAAYVALDPANPTERLQFMLRDSGANVVVTSTEIAETLAHPGTVVTLDAGLRSLDDQSNEPVLSDGGLNRLAYVIYTSGSTGEPKGVLIEHASLLNLVSWHRRAFSLSEDDRGTQIASPGFDAVVWELWPLLTAGASVHVPPEELRPDPPNLRDWLVTERVTISFLPTAIAESIISLEWPVETALRHLLTGGDALHRHPSARLPFTLVNNYGPAEATVVATSGPVPVADAAADAAPPSIGRPIDAVTLHIVDDQLQPVADGEVGELLIGGAGVARGYLNRPELTAEKFVADPSAGDGRRLYRTGDLVRLRPDGELEFVGRADEQVQIGGRRIELGEIAATLTRHVSVRRSVVIASGEGAAAKRLVAFVVPSDGEQPSAETLRSHLAATLPDYMLPADIISLTELPMTASDKVDRASLVALAASSAGGGGDPQNELEEAVAAIVAELLELPAVGVDKNFFLLGGHSLLGAQLIARIEERFGVELSLRDVFEKPTVTEMAQEVERLLVADLETMSDEEAELLMLVVQDSRAGAGH